MAAVPQLESFFAEVLRARTRIYRAGQPTPQHKILIPSIDAEIYVKREDLSPINAYKWRGAYNCVAVMHETKGVREVVAASAGNHAQGVALAARMLGIQAKIYMPLPTPLMKQRMVAQHGGEHVDIILTGDTYDQASAAAREYAAQHNLAYIHPFDDIYTIAGQATIADELALCGLGPFDYVFVQIGGGGMAAGVANWLSLHHPDTQVLGVEGVGQACMAASFAAGHPVTLESVDTFCDGTAVKRPGDLTFDLCRHSLRDIITVTNDEVCAAIQQLWDSARVIPEPSGAMGLAGLIQFALANPDLVRGKKLLAVICGANMDFGKLAMISSQSAVGAHRRRYLRLGIDEKSGSLLTLLESVFPDVNVSEFQYGKVSNDAGYPVIAFEADPDKVQQLTERLQQKGVAFEDVTGDTDARYRIIRYDPSLFKNPFLLHVHFPERRGALRDFLRKISSVANVCYFNYAYSGESIGRAIIGFELEQASDRASFDALIADTPVTCRPLAEDEQARILGLPSRAQ